MALRPGLLALFCACAAQGCGPSIRASSDRGPADQSPILVATERASRGGRLVEVSADGARQAVLTELRGPGPTVDMSPTFSPDGKHVVFVSNRERDKLATTNLWVVAASGGTPVRLTRTPAVDRDARISADGRWLYFCSNRTGSFELFRAPLDLDAPKIGAVQQLTDTRDQVLSPSLSPDGSRVVYMAVEGGGKSRLWTVAADGSSQPQALTEGPMDLTPAWSPTGSIVFSSTVPGRDDVDLYLMSSDGSGRRLLFNAPDTDETGPRWSQDGRFLFAIATYRSAKDGKPILSSVVFVDLQEEPMRLRALHDPSAVESRIGLALAPVPLNAASLHENAPYDEALRKVILQAAIRNEGQRASGEP